MANRNIKFCIIFLLVLSVFVIIERASIKKSSSRERFSILENSSSPAENLTTTTAVASTAKYFFEGKEWSTSCPIGPHNNVSTFELPNKKIHDEWIRDNQSRNDFLNANISLIASYVYDDHVAVTFTSRNHFGQKFFCRYFDCRRREIAIPQESVVFPDSTVYCPRRFGADFMSISEESDGEPATPVKLIDRTGEYKHFLSVCLAPFHGSEPKWLQIAEFIEYHKMMGVSMFYLYVVKVDDYTRKLISDYARTGDVEVVEMHHRYWIDDWMWHIVTLMDCHQRAKNHAKWTGVIDLDERFQLNTTGPYTTIAEYLETITDANVTNVQFKPQWVQKTADSPAKYINDTHTIQEMIFNKYHLTSQMGSYDEQQKNILRPDRVGSLFIHYPRPLYPGSVTLNAPTEIAWLRHYRTIHENMWKFEKAKMMSHAPFYNSSIDDVIAKPLIRATLKRVKSVYNMVDEDCEYKQEAYRRYGQTAPCWEEKMRLEELEKERIEKMELALNETDSISQL